MQCKDIQEWIITDYLDEQMDEGQKKDIESHIGVCRECCKFARNAKETVIDPFEQTQDLSPSLKVWQNIKEAIEPKQETIEGPLTEFWEKARKLFPVPRPAFALAVIVILGLTSVFSLSNKMGKNDITQVSPQEEVEYLAYWIDETDSAGLDENGGYGTALEEYFL